MLASPPVQPADPSRRLDAARAAAETVTRAAADLERLVGLVTAALPDAGEAIPDARADGGAAVVPARADASSLELLEAVAASIAAHLEESRALMAIAEVTCALARVTDLDEVHARICRAALVAAGADGAALLVRRGETLQAVAATEPVLEHLPIPVGPRSLTGRVCVSGRGEFHTDVAQVPASTRRVMRRAGARAVAAQPVGTSGPDDCLGVLLVFWQSAMPELPPHAQSLLATLAGEAAVALDRATLVERLATLSSTDELTGLANRRALFEALARETARAARTGEPLSVGMVDLDHFKRYNDRCGHQAGDMLLRHAADAWRDAVRRSDLVARYGGEEFAFVLPCCGEVSARHLADRIRAAVPDGQTASVGIATWDGVEPPEMLLERADRALYVAKRAGRDRVVYDLLPARSGALGSAAVPPPIP